MVSFPSIHSTYFVSVFALVSFRIKFIERMCLALFFSIRNFLQDLLVKVRQLITQLNDMRRLYSQWICVKVEVQFRRVFRFRLDFNYFSRLMSYR
ncbi:hypothetical protein ACQ4LE_001904 [Meloidogyne hapla]